MSLTGIDAALDRAVQQFSGDHRIQNDTKAAFLEAFTRFLNEAGLAHLAAEGTREVTPGASGAIATQPILPESRVPARAASSALFDSTLPALDQLPDTLAAGDPQYNAREAMLRERLNLPALEHRLRTTAQSLGIDYSVDDLEGILRNAGYDAVHLGSSERYMAAIERFTAAAEQTYQTRANNVPGSNA